MNLKSTKIKLLTQTLDFGDCYIAYEYTQIIELQNETALPAFCNFETQESSSKEVYTFVVGEGHESLSIFPGKKRTAQLKLRTLKSGHIRFAVGLQVAGRSELSYVEVRANGIGPKLTSSCSKLDWGRAEVLQTHSRQFVLTNSSLIKAFADLSCNSAGFECNPKQLCLEPMSSAIIEVEAYLDDATLFHGILTVHVRDAPNISIGLQAKGVGTTIQFLPETAAVCDFGTRFTCNSYHIQFKLVNSGRRAQTLTWNVEEQLRDFQNHKHFDDLVCFTVSPPKLEIQPGQEEIITIQSFSPVQVTCSDHIVCYASVGNSISRHRIKSIDAKARFIEPTVKASSHSLHFNYDHGRADTSSCVLQRSFILKSESPLQLNGALSTSQNFEVCPAQFTLEPYEEASFIVSFVPDQFLNNKASSSSIGWLRIHFSDHPNTVLVDLAAHVSFPNISFTANEIDFGCVMDGVGSQFNLKVLNTSSLEVNYKWHLLNHCDESIVDISPLNGSLRPNESDDVRFFVSTWTQGEFSGVACCSVENGPVYHIPLHYRAHSISYDVDKDVLDIGKVSYLDIIEDGICIDNTSNVPSIFSIHPSPNPLLLLRTAIHPQHGVIKSKGRVRVAIKFVCAIPGQVDDFVLLQMGSLPIRKIRIIGEGVCPLPCFDSAITTLNDLFVVESMTRLRNLAEEDDLLGRQRVNILGSSYIWRKCQGHNPKGRKETLCELGEIEYQIVRCDFGVVLSNTSRRKHARLRNNLDFTVSCSVDSSKLAATPFEIQQEKLKISPKDDSIGLDILCQTKGLGIPCGPVECITILQVYNGPRITLRLRALVTVPDLIMQPNIIDFAELSCGFRKTVKLRLQNPSPATCEWRAEGSERLRILAKKKHINADPADFQLSPSQGIVLPDHEVTIDVSFAPTSGNSYDLRLPVLVQYNPKPYYAQLKGIGYELNLELSPNVLDFGIIHPYSDGVEIICTLRNINQQAIEVYSKDFDRKHLEEQEMLWRYGQITGEKKIYLPPRKLGDSWPDFILQALSLGRTEDTNAERRANHLENDAPMGVILHGPPFSGKSAQALTLEKLHKIKCLTVDTALKHVLESDQMNVESMTRLRKVVRWAQGNPESEDNEKEQSTAPLEETVTEALKNRLSWKDCSQGFVIDGLQSDILKDPQVTLKTLFKSVMPKTKVHLFLLNVDSRTIRERELALRRKLAKVEQESLEVVKEVAEEEYDLMTDNERTSYDLNLKTYKAKLKELQERQLGEHVKSEEGSVKNEDKKDELTSRKKEKSRNRKQTDKLSIKNPTGNRLADLAPTSPRLTRKVVGTLDSSGALEALGSRVELRNEIDSVNLSEMVSKQLQGYKESNDAILSLAKELSSKTQTPSKTAATPAPPSDKKNSEGKTSHRNI